MTELMTQKLTVDVKANLSEEEYHQTILDLGYAEWRKNDGWGYSDMIEWVRQTYGEIAAFAILIGKYNQQVCNGGHIQYYDNGYASQENVGWNDIEKDTNLHENLKDYLEKFKHLINSEVKSEVFGIVSAFFVEIDDERYVEEECWDEEKEEYYTDQFDNENYGCVLNNYEMNNWDQKYYEVYAEWMKDLEEFFKSVIEGEIKVTEQKEETQKPVEKKIQKPKVKLTGTDGNAFAIMGKVKAALRKAGYPQDLIDRYIEESTSGDYNNLLRVAMKYVDVE